MFIIWSFVGHSYHLVIYRTCNCCVFQTAEMALRLSAVNRWCVTGTPIQKGVEGRFSQLSQ